MEYQPGLHRLPALHGAEPATLAARRRSSIPTTRTRWASCGWTWNASADAAGYEIFSAAAPSPAFADAAARLAAAPRWQLPADVAALAGRPRLQRGDGRDRSIPAPLGRARRGSAGDSTRCGDAKADLVAAGAPGPVPGRRSAVADRRAVRRRPARRSTWPWRRPRPTSRPIREAWWRARLRAAARRHPGRAWRLDVLDAAGRRTHGWQADRRATATRPAVWLLHGKHAGDNAQIDAFAAALGWPSRLHRLRFSPLSRLPGWLKGASRSGLRRQRAVARAAVAGSGHRRRPAQRQRGALDRPPKRRAHAQRAARPAAGAAVGLRSGGHHAAVRSAGARQRAAPAGTAGIAGTADDATLDAWRARWAALPRPWIGLLVGGDRAPYRLDADAAGALAAAARALAAQRGGSVLATTGPRTTPAAAEALFAALGEPAFRHRYAPGQADNPYRPCWRWPISSSSPATAPRCWPRRRAPANRSRCSPPADARAAQRLLHWLEQRLGLVERGAGSRGTARQQNRAGPRLRPPAGGRHRQPRARSRRRAAQPGPGQPAGRTRPGAARAGAAGAGARRRRRAGARAADCRTTPRLSRRLAGAGGDPQAAACRRTRASTSKASWRTWSRAICSRSMASVTSP